MGLKFVNKGCVVVDCADEVCNGKQWTLVNNRTMERIYCQSGVDAVEKLRDACTEVQNYLDELRKEGDKEKTDGYGVRACFVGIDEAPTLVNLLDESDHVVEWRAERNNMLSHGEHYIVRIDYKSDRQLLFQEGGKVVFRDEEAHKDAGEEDAQYEEGGRDRART